MRILTKRTKLYTEMVVDNTVMHSDTLDWHLRFTEAERPIALQMGGSDPEMLEQAVEKILAEGFLYDEIDLNCGCPSDRVATVSRTLNNIMQFGIDKKTLRRRAALARA